MKIKFLKDKWLVVTIIAIIVDIAVTGFLYYEQTKKKLNWKPKLRSLRGLKKVYGNSKLA